MENLEKSFSYTKDINNETYFVDNQYNLCLVV